MQQTNPFTLFNLELREFDVSLGLESGGALEFRIKATAAADFHDFIRDVRESEQTWVKVDAVDPDTGKTYVTGFDPRKIVVVDVEALDDEDAALDGPCGPDCTCFPQVSVESAPAAAEGEEKAEETEAPKNPLESLLRDLEARRPGAMPLPPLPGLLGLAIIASALSPKKG